MLRRFPFSFSSSQRFFLRPLHARHHDTFICYHSLHHQKALTAAQVRLLAENAHSL